MQPRKCGLSDKSVNVKASHMTKCCCGFKYSDTGFYNSIFFVCRASQSERDLDCNLSVPFCLGESSLKNKIILVCIGCLPQFIFGSLITFVGNG